MAAGPAAASSGANTERCRDCTDGTRTRSEARTSLGDGRIYTVLTRVTCTTCGGTNRR